jgi:hypothetical protein
VAWNQFFTAILISVICIKICSAWQSIIRNKNIINEQITHYSRCHYSWIFEVDIYWLIRNSICQLPTSKKSDLLNKPPRSTLVPVPSCAGLDNSMLTFGNVAAVTWPPLWSSGQSSWLQIPWPGFDSRHYQGKKSSGFETGSTQPQPREYNWGAAW